MTPERYQKIRSVFHEVHTLPAAERVTRLRDLCAGDSELEAEVVKLIGRASDATGFLDKPAISGTPLAGLASAGEVPEKIGPYKIVEKLGGGGMGDVYLAEQSHPIKRRVALKVIREGMDSKGVVARFELERQALALMDHSNIAKVFDAGTDKGRPYFVMEYVPGMHLTEYCDRHRLSLEDRLGLFHDVCDAVQHAHSKGIIHRDLKPSNILVMRREGEAPLVKIIDFGVAKATETSGAGDFSIHTMSGTPIGTWDYMSPEQAAGRVGKIDIRSDVYSMGVILYELLTGLTPIDLEDSASSSMMEVQQAIVKAEAPRPSTRVRDLGAKLEHIADMRRTSGHGLTRVLRRDLDWVVMKAIEKDAGRRYQTARELGDEIKRFLRNEPVLAGPPTAAYRVAKFVRRNRALVVGGVSVIVVLIAGLAASWVLFLRSQDALERMTSAQQQASLSAEEAQRSAAEAERRRGLEAEARRVADEKTREAEEQRELAVERQAELAARAASMSTTIDVLLGYLDGVLTTEGRISREMLLDSTGRVIDRVIAEEPNESRPRIAQIRFREVLGQYDAMAALAREALRDEHWRQNVWEFWYYLGLAELQRGRSEAAAEALVSADRVIAARAALLPADAVDPAVVELVDELKVMRATVLAFLGEAQRCMGRIESAREYLGEARELYRSTRHAQETGEENTFILANLGLVEYQRGVPSAAAGWFRRALRVRPDTEDAREFLLHSLHASALRSLSERREQRAADDLAEAARLSATLLRHDDPLRCMIHALWGKTLVALGRDAEGERVLLRTLHAMDPGRRRVDPAAEIATTALGELYQRQGRAMDLLALSRLAPGRAAAAR